MCVVAGGLWVSVLLFVRQRKQCVVLSDCSEFSEAVAWLEVEQRSALAENCSDSSSKALAVCTTKFTSIKSAKAPDLKVLVFAEIIFIFLS